MTGHDEYKAQNLITEISRLDEDTIYGTLVLQGHTITCYKQTITCMT
jgi:hypothetical protein